MDLYSAVDFHAILAESTGRVSKHEIRAANLEKMTKAVEEMNFCWKKEFDSVQESVKLLKVGLAGFESEVKTKKAEKAHEIEVEVLETSIDVSDLLENNEFLDERICEDDIEDSLEFIIETEDSLESINEELLEVTNEETLEANSNFTLPGLNHIDSVFESVRSLRSRRDLFDTKKEIKSRKIEAVKTSIQSLDSSEDEEEQNDDERDKTVLNLNCCVFMDPTQVEELVECVSKTVTAPLSHHSKPTRSVSAEATPLFKLPEAPKKKKRSVTFSSVLEFKNVSWNDWQKYTRSGKAF